MSEILEIQILRAKVLNKINELRNPNKTRFVGDISYINGRINALREVLGEIDNSLKK